MIRVLHAEGDPGVHDARDYAARQHEQISDLKDKDREGVKLHTD